MRSTEGIKSPLHIFILILVVLFDSTHYHQVGNFIVSFTVVQINPSHCREYWFDKSY